MSALPTDSGIYLMTYIPTGDTYVGQAVNLRLRQERHAYKVRTGFRQNRFISKLIDLGCAPDDFTFRALQLCGPDLLNEREAHWIAKLKPTLNHYSPKGFRVS